VVPGFPSSPLKCTTLFFFSSYTLDSWGGIFHRQTRWHERLSKTFKTYQEPSNTQKQLRRGPLLDLHTIFRLTPGDGRTGTDPIRPILPYLTFSFSSCSGHSFRRRRLPGVGA
jgi:hypothetical protein